MSVKIMFTEPAPRLSMNDRLFWRVKNEYAQEWRTATFYAARNLRPTAQPPCFMRVTFPVPDNRRRDADNPAPTCKAIQDGLVDAGIWPDDTPEWVETLGSRFEKGAEFVVVELIPR